MTLPSLTGSTTTPLIVKALNGEILLNSLVKWRSTVLVHDARAPSARP